MSKVNVNDIQLSVARESTFGSDALEGSAYKLEPNEINNYGGNITTVARSPIGDRQRRKGTPTDFEAAVELASDLTLGTARLWMPGFTLNPAGEGAVTVGNCAGKAGNRMLTLGEVTPSIVVGSLIVTRGFDNPANQITSPKKVTAVNGKDITVAGVAEERAGAGKTVEVVGYEGLNWSGDRYTPSGVGTWAALGVKVGMWVHIGGDTDDSKYTGVQAGLNGWYKVKEFAGQNNVEMGLEGTDNSIGDSEKVTAHIYFGKRYHNVSPHDVAGGFEEMYYRFEAAYKGLGANGTTEYEYIAGCAPNQITLSLPLTDKATYTAQFAARSALDIVAEAGREGKFAGAVALAGQEAINTSADFARLKLSGDGVGNEEAYFKSLELVINNNFSAEKVLGRKGAAFMNLGILEVSATAEVLFTDKSVVNAITGNKTVSLNTVVRNNDGGIMFEIPSLTLGGGQKQFPLNETVRLSLDASAHRDETYGDSINVQIFGYLPASADTLV